MKLQHLKGELAMHAPLFASSRGRIVQLLRRTAQSVHELAAVLGLTGNAVRAHLVRLERDGLVQQAGSRPAFRKPEAVYEITPDAERLFAKAYAPVLANLLATLEVRLDEEDLDSHLREAGRRLAAPHLESMKNLPLKARAARTLKIVEDLGGLAAVEEREGRVYVRGFGCPLSQIVAAHPKLCVVAQVLIGELLGREVQEECQRGDRPKCCFSIE
jgi:predicted ArsR family transcriptional regulator